MIVSELTTWELIKLNKAIDWELFMRIGLPFMGIIIVGAVVVYFITRGKS